MRFSLTSKDDEDITVKAPAKSVISPEKKIEKATKKSLEKERFGVLQFPKKISKYLGITATITGGLLLTLFAFMSITGQTNAIFLSLGFDSFSILVWGFVGIVNIALGLFFLGSE